MQGIPNWHKIHNTYKTCQHNVLFSDLAMTCQYFFYLRFHTPFFKDLVSFRSSHVIVEINAAYRSLLPLELELNHLALEIIK